MIDCETLDLLSWRPASRHTDPETSRLAADDVSKHCSAGRTLVLLHLLNGALTDFELADRTGWAQTSIGKRRGELVAIGYVEPHMDAKGDPVRRPAPSGSLARTWAITAKGRDAYHQGRRAVG